MNDDNCEETPPQDKRLAPLRGRIGRICQIVRYAALAWFLWSVALHFWFWGRKAEQLARLSKYFDIDSTTVSDVGYWAAFGVTLIDVSVSGAMVWAIWRLMRGYLGGEIFTLEAATRLRGVALAGFAATLADIVARPIVASLVSASMLSKLPLHHWLGPQDLLYALICGFLLAIAAIFKTAAEIADEHSQIV